METGEKYNLKNTALIRKLQLAFPVNEAFSIIRLHKNGKVSFQILNDRNELIIEAFCSEGVFLNNFSFTGETLESVPEIEQHYPQEFPFDF